ncbi:thiamine pyrophosphate-requiring protein [Variovorax sp. OV329]|uniref:thiamine pyrophosphate-requiring protein n=1 Tax=Variovorax sp. OV329 TaxID=1882825 RepID=UPI0008E78B88|nr:thiamine pyrophosphate-requiring protein [Variovorax sp. OV329]SFN39837.1 pyruvate dehydrogenase (quinone) [Variovorax sp. OV329]
MSMNVSEFVWKRLQEWGLHRVYGYPGDGVGGLDVALEKDKGMHYVQVRHEEMAAFMAAGHAKFTGEVGLCYATSGPGAIHLLNGLYDARMDHVPVVAIVGQQARSAIGSSYQQEVDLQCLFKDVASEFVATASVPAQVRHLVDRAVRIAASRRTVTCIILPQDLQQLDYEDPPMAHGATHTGTGYADPAPVPAQAQLQRAAEVLNAGRKVAMLVGAGVLGATDPAILVADRLQAGAAKALLGKAALPDELPWVTGCIGLLGTEPSWHLMQECDTLLMVGSAFPYSEFLPKPGKARGVQIDIDPARLSLRYPMEVNLVGDSASTLLALLPLLEQKSGEWREDIQGRVAKWWKLLEERAMQPAEPINPQRVFWELSSRLPEDCIFTGDAGTVANWYARDIRMRRGMMGSLSGGLASLGSATPYALAAKMAHPGRPVIAFIGDGAMQMNGLNVMITIAKYWRQWKDPRLVVMVLNNRDLSQVTWEERVQMGEGKTESTQALPDFPYHRYAELLGLKGIRVDKPEALGAAWDEALSADRPVLLECVTDPNVPPLPPHISAKEALGFMGMTRSEPELGSVLVNTARQVLARVLPGHKG